MASYVYDPNKDIAQNIQDNQQLNTGQTGEYDALKNITYPIESRISQEAGDTVVAHDWQGTTLSIQDSGGTWGQYVDLQGPEGPAGPKGDMANHEWSGTQVRFENPDGTWGVYTDLQGPQGPAPAHEWSGQLLRFQNPDGSWGEWTYLKGDKGEKGDRGQDGVALPWDAQTTYYKHAMAVWGNILYWSNVDGNTGNRPDQSETWTQWINDPEADDETPLGTIMFWNKSLEARTQTAKVTGTADTDTENNLVDSSAFFVAISAIAVGDIVHNTTDNTYATVQAVSNETTLSLDWDAFPAGTEEYEIYPEPSVHPAWIEFGDGSGSDLTIDDPDSPFNGMTVPDIIGEERFVRARETAGRLQDVTYQSGGSSAKNLSAIPLLKIKKMGKLIVGKKGEKGDKGDAGQDGVALPWDSGTTYNKDDIAVYENSLYYSTVDGNVGNTPDTSNQWVRWLNDPEVQDELPLGSVSFWNKSLEAKTKPSKSSGMQIVLSNGTDNLTDGSAAFISNGIVADEIVWFNEPSSLHFDGTDDRVQIPDNSIFQYMQSGAHTMEAWVNIPTTNTAEGVLVFPGSSDTWLIYNEAGNNKVLFHTFSGSAVKLYSTSPLNDGNPHHIAAVHDGTNIYLYVDGVLDASGTASLPSSTSREAGIGVDYNYNNRYFEGNIAEVRFWSTARTQQEINDNRFSSLVGTEVGLQAYYKLDDGNESVVAVDSGPFGVNGDIYGGAKFTGKGQKSYPATVLSVNTETQIGLDYDTQAAMYATYTIYEEPNVQVGWIEFGDGSGSDFTINDPESPFDGMSIPDIIGDERFIRARKTAGVIQEDAIRNILGEWRGNLISSQVNNFDPDSALYGEDNGNNYAYSSGSYPGSHAKFDASRNVPTAEENRPKNISAVPILKIKKVGRLLIGPQGPEGPEGPAGQAEFIWQSTQTYNIDDPVWYNGMLYISKQNANTGNPPDSSSDWWYLYFDTTFNIFYGRHTTSLDISSGTIIPFDTLDQEDDWYTYNPTYDEVVFNESGYFFIHYHITTGVTSGTARSDSYAWLELNVGTGWQEIPGSRGGMYNRESGKGLANASVRIYQYVDAGDRIRLYATRDSGTDTVVTIADTTALLIQPSTSLQGPQGDPPVHEWSGTQLRFENNDGTWGPYTDLAVVGPEGPQGPQGLQGDPGADGIALPWESTTTYQQNAVVAHDSILYRSLADGNTNNTPDTSPDWWAPWVVDLKNGEELPLGSINFWHKSLEARTGVAKTSGVISVTQDSKLINTNADFLTSGSGIQIGDIVFNEDDNTYATVQGLDSSTQIALDWDAFPSGGANYTIYPQPDVQPGWIEFGDGSGNDLTIDDPDSPFDGMTIPDIIGEERFIRARETAGRVQADQMQGHWHEEWYYMFDSDGGNANGTLTRGTGENNNKGANDINRDAISDGTNGTPRTGDETHPKNLSAVPILKIKNSGDVKLATYYSVEGDNFATLASGTDLDPADKLVYWDESAQVYKSMPVSLLNQAGWPSILIDHVEPAGTDAGHTEVDVWTPRELNSVRHNEIPDASFDVQTYQLTLSAGKYYSTFFTSSMRVQNIGLRLRDNTHGVTLLTSNVTWSENGTGDSALLKGEGFFELPSEATIQLQYFAESDGSDDYNLGITNDNAAYSEDVVHAQLHVWQRYANAHTVSTQSVNNINFPPGVLVYHHIDSYADAPANTWNTTPINQIQHNAVANASVDVNTHQITLPAGTYYAEAVQVFQETQDSFARIHDVTNNVTLLYGQSGYNHGGTTAWNSNIRGYFTLNAETTIELQNKFDDSGATYAIGRNENMGPTNVSFIHVLQINEFQNTYTVSQDNNINRPPRMQLQERQPSGTDSNAASRNFSSWLAREVNTVVMNEITGASLDAANYQFTLPPGLYDINYHAIVAQANGFTTRLWNVTLGKVAIQGTGGYADEDSGGTNFAHNPAFGMQTIDIDQECTFELQMEVQSNTTSGWLGGTAGSRHVGNAVLHEVYANINIDQVEAFEITRNFTISQDNNVNTPPLFMIEQRADSSTPTSTNQDQTWLPREFNVIANDDQTGATLDATNWQFTLPAGKWWIDWWETAYDTDHVVDQLYDVTHGQVLIVGSRSWLDDSSNTEGRLLGSGYIELTETTVLELRHWAQYSNEDVRTWGRELVTVPVPYALLAQLKAWKVLSFDITRTFTISQDNNINRPPRMLLEERGDVSVHMNTTYGLDYNGYNSLPFNTEAMNEIQGASHDPSTFQATLPPGKYDINWNAHVDRPGYHSTRLYDVTHQVPLIQGSATYLHTSYDRASNIWGDGYVDLSTYTEDTVIEVQFTSQSNTSGDFLTGHHSNGEAVNYELHGTWNIYQIESHSIDITYNVTQENNINRPPRLHVQEVQPYGTGDRDEGRAGSLDADDTWTTRRLDTLRMNEITGASFDPVTHQVTLPPGKYDVDWIEMLYHVHSHTSQLYDITHNEVLIQGTMGRNNDSYSTMSNTHGRGTIDLTETTTLEIQSAGENSTGSTYDMGESWPEGQVSRLQQQIYADLQIDQVEAHDITIDYSITQQHNINFPPTLLLEERQPAGTDGGDIGTTWQPRKMNTAVVNEVTGASLDSGSYEFTLPPGRYYIEAEAPAYSVYRHMIRLFDVKKHVAVLWGSTERNHVSYAHTNPSTLSGYINVEVESEFRIEHKSETNRSGNGMGYAVADITTFNDVPYEKYATATIRQIEAFEITENYTISRDNNINRPPTIHVQARSDFNLHDGPTGDNDTWLTQKLNTLVSNEIVGGDLDNTSFQLTLPPGLYDFDWWTKTHGTYDYVSSLWDVTHSVPLLYSGGGRNNATDAQSYFMPGRGTVEFTEETTVELRYKFQSNSEDAWSAGYNISNLSSVPYVINADLRAEQVEAFEITRNFTISKDNNINRPPRMQLQHREAAGTRANQELTDYSNWNTLKINTVTSNEIQQASLNHGTWQFTLPPGLYDVSWWQNVTYCDRFQSRLHDVTHNQTVIVGKGGFANNDSWVELTTFGDGTIDVIEETTFELQFQANVNSAQDYITGNGTYGSLTGVDYELFANIDIYQIEAHEITRDVTYTYSANTPPTMIVEDQKPSGTASGDFNSGAWRTRDLNTIELNEITGASLSANQITLPAGSYEVWGSAAVHRVDRHVVRLRDITNNAVLITGMGNFAQDTSDVSNFSDLWGRITLTGTTVLELQHECETSHANNGFGLAVGGYLTVDHETYSRVVIKKIA